MYQVEFAVSEVQGEYAIKAMSANPEVVMSTDVEECEPDGSSRLIATASDWRSSLTTGFSSPSSRVTRRSSTAFSQNRAFSLQDSDSLNAQDSDQKL